MDSVGFLRLVAERQWTPDRCSTRAYEAVYRQNVLYKIFPIWLIILSCDYSSFQQNLGSLVLSHSTTIHFAKINDKPHNTNGNPTLPSLTSHLTPSNKAPPNTTPPSPQPAPQRIFGQHSGTRPPIMPLQPLKPPPKPRMHTNPIPTLHLTIKPFPFLFRCFYR